MFLVDPVRGSDGTYPGSPAGWSIVPVQELKSAVKFGHFLQICCSPHEHLSMTHFKHYIPEVF